MAVPRHRTSRSVSHPASDDDSDSELELRELTSSSRNGLRVRAESASGQYTGYPIRLRNLAHQRNPSSAVSDSHGRNKSIDGAGSEQSELMDDDSPLLPGTAADRAARKTRAGRQSIVGRMWARLRSTGRADRLVDSSASTAAHENRARTAEDGMATPAGGSKDAGPARVVRVGRSQDRSFPANAVSNAKYTAWSFLPVTLYNEFSFFFNLYFLFVALSQIIPPLRIGYLSTYIAPLAFVMTISIGKEAIDDIARRRRDSEANSEVVTVLSFDTVFKTDGSQGTTSETMVPARDIKVGDVLKLEKNQRVPADVVMLKCVAGDDEVAANPAAKGGSGGAPTGEAFIRTDQLDGETDWKLRLAAPLSQRLDLADLARLQITAGRPSRSVNSFDGTLSLLGQGDADNTDDDESDENTHAGRPVPLEVDNTAWANTVIASSCTVYAAVVYTGSQTRQAMSTSRSRSKTGLLERELNALTKILCFLTLFLSCVLVAGQRLEPAVPGTSIPAWYVSVMRYLILFSTIVPVSLRVNIDMAKSMCAWAIEHDRDIPDTVVRTSTIPEDLGRIEYLLTDKTGTLTLNEMTMKKIHLGTVSYTNEAMAEVAGFVRQSFVASVPDRGAGDDVLVTPSTGSTHPNVNVTRTGREIGSRVRDLVLALAVCHNVTPTVEYVGDDRVTNYQASSPDEIAIVQWIESVGLRLASRDRHTIVLESVETGMDVCRARILHTFPFTSEGKRMGVIVNFATSRAQAASGAIDRDGKIWFFLKGADTVMSKIVGPNDWLAEQTSNMAREGLRTLVVSRKELSAAAYEKFRVDLEQANIRIGDRAVETDRVIRSIEADHDLLGITGVEDRLQQGVRPSLEQLSRAGVKVWMLTGDKVETARCVATSARLVGKKDSFFTIEGETDKDAAAHVLTALEKRAPSGSMGSYGGPAGGVGGPGGSGVGTGGTHVRADHSASLANIALLIDGDSLATMLAHHQVRFVSVAVLLPAVICCRCSPMQKAEVTRLIRMHTKKRVASIGDGGNDVSMIQAADVGIGIVGKEGRQASLAADFSITQFEHIIKLLVWHGRNSYKRSASLALFVMHRGLIFAVCQTVYSIASSFEPVALFRDWLLVGYATVYTMVPVFSLVKDRDVDEAVAGRYPELYNDLTSKADRLLGYRSFFVWVVVSVYQGAVIQVASQVLVGIGPDKFKSLVAVSFTALVVNELLMVAAAVTTWHWLMACSIIGTAILYFGSIPFLADYFDLDYVLSVPFLWKTSVALALAFVPPYFVKFVSRVLRPPNYRKVQAQ